MNHTKRLIGKEIGYCQSVPDLSIQAADDGVWLHFTTTDGMRHSSLNLHVRFGPGQHLYDDTICQWARDYAKAIGAVQDK